MKKPIHHTSLHNNAPEAEEDLPERIVTPARDLGTYLGASLFWQGREDRALVSARLNSLNTVHPLATP